MASRMQRPTVLLVFALVALAMVVTACFGGKRAEKPAAEQQAAAPSAPAAPAAPAAPEQAAAPAAPEQAAPAAPSAPPAAEGGAIVVVASDEGGRFRFEPNRIEVRAGQPVTLRVVNQGPSPHDL
ncbi:MAG TPA: hypothetical protein VIL11_04710, partial [Limnochordales bacterium]